MKRVIILIYFIPFIGLFGQTGPGGVGNNSNNEIWLSVTGNCYTDAGSTLGSNNSKIQQWNDISGNDNHAIQLTTTKRPILKTNQANGFSSLRFDGNRMRMLSSGVSTSNQVTILTVVKFNGFSHNNDGIIQASPSGKAFSIQTADKSIGMWVKKTNHKIWGRGVQSDNTTNIPQTTALSTGQFYIITQDYNGSTISQYVDGANAGSVAYDGTLRSWTDFGIGRQGNETLNGDIAEIIAYTVSLNSAQKIITENYLAAKYGLSLSSNDLYDEDDASNGDYDYHVAGIGRVDASNIHDDAQGSSIVRILNPSGLDDSEFLFWGDDNVDLDAINTTDIPSSLQGRLDRVWRASEVNTSGSAADVGSIDMRWDLSDLDVASASDLRLLIDTDNDGVFADETPISGAIDLGGNIYEFAGVTDLANNLRFTLGTIDLVTLDIGLISFDARVVDNKYVQLEWSTASETNDSYFTIEKSVDGKNWQLVSTVDGAGNSSGKLEYHAIDKTPFTGTSYYRLKQTDSNGNSKNLDTKMIYFKQNTSGIIIYPNPAYNQITVQADEQELTDIRIYKIPELDVTNKVKQVSKSNNTILMDISGLPSGMYIIKTKTGVSKVYKK